MLGLGSAVSSKVTRRTIPFGNFHRLLSLAADLLGFHIEALRYHVQHDRIPLVRPRREYRITYGALKRFVRQHRNSRYESCA
jgi:hypothetical protein